MTEQNALPGSHPVPLRLSVLEPSKVRNQHATLLAGIVAAGAELPAERRASLIAHASVLRELPQHAVSRWSPRTIPVMDPERRRLVRKSLLEALVVCWRIARLERSEVLLVTCLLPPALIVVEMVKRLFPQRHVVVMIHGEIEGAFEADRQHRGSFGYYVKKWLALRRWNSTLRLAVIDDFIAAEMVRSFGDTIRRKDIFVLPHPVTAMADMPCVAPVGAPRVCFIGFRTGFKGYPVFERLAARTPEATFVAIGAGQVEVVSKRAVQRLDGTSDYMRAIATCDVAVFPYVGGYRASLSAAALDAVSAGVHLIASRRGCFISLHETLGDDFVTLFDDEHEVQALLSDPAWIAACRAGRLARMAAIERSKYGIPSLTKALAMLTDQDVGSQDGATGVVTV